MVACPTILASGTFGDFHCKCCRVIGAHVQVLDGPFSNFPWVQTMAKQCGGFPGSQEDLKLTGTGVATLSV
jgi:hypothetical protein